MARPPLPLTVLDLARASPRLTLASLGLAALNGVLGPGFMLATGGLVQAVSDGADLTLPLVAMGLLFVLMRSIDPIRGELGALLWPRVDEWIARRIMLAMTRPPGLKEIESPEVHDRVAQARGIVWGFTPGQAAQHVGDLWQFRMNSLASLAIVAWWYWWAAVLLAAVYAVGWLVARRHYLDVTQVMWGRTDAMRRAFYVRTLGLSSRIAKQTRIFDFARWLIDQYRLRSLAVLEQVWRKRREGWLRATLLFAAIAVVEVVVLRAIALGTAVAVAQAVLSAGLLSRYEDNDSELTEAQRALEKVAELDRRLTDLVVPARRVAAQVQQTTARRTIAVHAAVPELIGEWDAVRLERVLGNLLGNAVKYNPEGSDVSVEIRQEQQDGHAWACVGIRDRGIGIPAADLPRIFERYHRAANVVGRFPGEGIGLAGARQVIEQHGGMIGVHSHEGQGSTFTVRLRIHRDRLPAE